MFSTLHHITTAQVVGAAPTGGEMAMKSILAGVRGTSCRTLTGGGLDPTSRAGSQPETVTSCLGPSMADAGTRLAPSVESSRPIYVPLVQHQLDMVTGSRRPEMYPHINNRNATAGCWSLQRTLISTARVSGFARASISSAWRNKTQRRKQKAAETQMLKGSLAVTGSTPGAVVGIDQCRLKSSAALTR